MNTTPPFGNGPGRGPAAVVGLLVAFLALGDVEPTSAQVTGTNGLGFDSAELGSLVDQTARRIPKQAPNPPSLVLNVEVGETPLETPVDPVDVEQLLAEDRNRTDADKVLRYSVGRDVLLNPSNEGRWYDVPGRGRLWVADVAAPGAMGLRLHFADVNLPPGAEVFVYPLAEPVRLIGPYRGHGHRGAGEFWTATLYADHLRVEYFVPLGVGDAAARTGFVIDALQHVYRDPRGGEGRADPDRACRDDVTCYPSWAGTANAVARVGYVSGSQGYVCTGTLLNSQAVDFTPYFLTADHCINDAAEALSAELYWFYQTDQCNGTAPALGDVLRSDDCTLLAHGSSTDFSLLMVEGELPSGLTWAGWTSGSISDGTGATGIHHPAGSWKRISFGAKSSTTSTHHWIDWSDGGTEGGSSGSGIFTNTGEYLFGQLSGNVPDCYYQDNYGAFSVSYPSMSSFLAGGSDDALEDNDSCASARTVGAGLWTDLVVKSVDEDWYNISIPAGKALKVDLTFLDAYGDIDVRLYDVCGGTVITSATSSTDNESLSFTNTGATAVYRLRVYLYSDTRNEYDMTIEIVDRCFTPPDYDAVIVPECNWQTTGLETIGIEGCRIYTMYLYADRFYDFSLCDNDGVGAYANSGDGDLTMYSDVGTQLWYIDGSSSCGYDASTLSTVYQAWSPPYFGYYYLKVSEYYDDGMTYVLAHKYSPPDPCSNPFPMFDGTPYAGTLESCGLWSDYSDCAWSEPGEERAYTFTTSIAGTYTITAGQTAGDPDFFLMSACDPASTNIIGTCWNAGVQSVSLAAATTYYLIVDNYLSGATSEYTLRIDFPPSDPPDPVVSSYDCGSTLLTRSGSPSANVTWYWQGTTCGTSTSLGSGPTYNATMAGTYYIRAQHDLTGEWSAGCGSVPAVVYPIPSTPSNAMANPSTICAGASSTLSATVDGGVIDWYDGSCGEGYVGTGFSIGVGPGTTRTYYARTRDMTSGCESPDCATVTVGVIAEGDRCGDSTDTDCDNPDRCLAGICADYLEPLGTVCTDDGNVCTDSECDGLGNCLAYNNSNPCDDGLFCNGLDTCAAGHCVQHAGDPCVPSAWCEEGGDQCIAYGNGDFEPDGDVDLRDFARFQCCFDDSALGGCEPANMSGDELVDLADFALFADQISGP